MVTAVLSVGVSGSRGLYLIGTFSPPSLTCLLSEPVRARSVAAFLPLPPCLCASLSFSREQGNMTGVDMRHTEPNNASYSQACSGLGAGPASSLCCWLIGSKKGFLPLATDGLKGDSRGRAALP